jgi:hypothetical protein
MNHRQTKHIDLPLYWPLSDRVAAIFTVVCPKKIRKSNKNGDKKNNRFPKLLSDV